MTDRPTHPLTKEEYLEIVLEAKMSPQTTEVFMVNFELINHTTHRMAIAAACENAWGSLLPAKWTEEGKKAIEAVIISVACCASFHIGETLDRFFMNTDAYKAIRALVGDRYKAYRLPSETYMCM